MAAKQTHGSYAIWFHLPSTLSILKALDYPESDAFCYHSGCSTDYHRKDTHTYGKIVAQKFELGLGLELDLGLGLSLGLNVERWLGLGLRLGLSFQLGLGLRLEVESELGLS